MKANFSLVLSIFLILVSNVFGMKKLCAGLLALTLKPDNVPAPLRSLTASPAAELLPALSLPLPPSAPEFSPTNAKYLPQERAISPLSRELLLRASATER